jgi:hypothetical protein
MITYIDVDGNMQEAEFINIPDNIEKIGNTYFEKRIVEPIKKVKAVEVKEEVKEEISEDVLERAKAFCKEQKIKGYGLLK